MLLPLQAPAVHQCAMLHCRLQSAAAGHQAVNPTEAAPPAVVLLLHMPLLLLLLLLLTWPLDGWQCS
jgi:hypothetical protein